MGETAMSIILSQWKSST